MSDALPTPDPTPSPAPSAPSDWQGLVGGLPDDLRPTVEGTGVKDFAGFVKHHAEVSKQVGKPRIPSSEERAKWTDAQRAEFADALGHPKEAKAYGLEEYRWDEKRLGENPSPIAQTAASLTNTMVDRFAEYAASKRMPREAAHDAVKFYQSFAEDVAKIRAESRTKVEAETYKRHIGKYGGEEGFDKAKGVASKGAQAVFGERFALFQALELPDGTGVLDSPEIFDMLVEIGKTLDEGDLPASRGMEGLSASGAQERLNALLADPEKQKALNDASHPQHQEVIAERARLFQVIRGSEPGDIHRQLFRSQGLNPDGSRKSTT